MQFIDNIGFNEKAADFLLNYNITDSEYLYCKELFFSNTDSLLKYSEQKTDSKAFLLKLFVMLAIDNFDSIINELSLKRSALANADLIQIYFDTMSDIRIWQDVYQRNTGQIGLIEPLWVSNLSPITRKILFIYIYPREKALKEKNAKLQSKQPRNFLVNICTLTAFLGY